jgi:transcription antitermination factor NusG
MFVSSFVSSAVFVQAQSREKIILACRDISSAMANRLTLVPEDEHEALKRKPKAFIPEDWVRFRKGKFIGDVALVREVDESKRTCKAFYIPRLDLDGKGKTASKGEKRIRPQQALFDPTVVRSARGGARVFTVDEQQNVYKYRGHTYTHGLRTEDCLSLDSVIQTTVTPTYEELLVFQKTGIIDIGQYNSTLNKITANSLKEGMKVTVITGQQAGLKGVVKELVDQDTIRIQCGTEDPASTLTFDIQNKYVKLSDYEIGDSIKVIRGDREGVEGLVVEVIEACVVIYDGKLKETVSPTHKHESELTKKNFIQFTKSVRDIEQHMPTEWIAPDPGKEERQTRKISSMPREGKHPIINRTCLILRPLEGSISKTAGQYKGFLCDVKDYNPYTNIATVAIQLAHKTMQLSGDCLFPR